MEADTLYLWGYLALGLQLAGLLAALHAIAAVRTSQGAIAWAVALAFMPYLTLLPYLVFGSRRFGRYLHIRREADRQMREAVARLDWRPWIDEALAAEREDPWGNLRAFSGLSGWPALANNRLRLLVNGEQTFAALFEAIAAARQVVLVQFFIVRDDDLGRRLQQLLLERAAAGVKVYLLYDRIGSHALPRRYVQRLREGGVQVAASSTHSGFYNRFQLNFRNHRKIVVVDGERGFLGGLNVGDDYLGGNPQLSPWRDTHLELQGPALACLQESFAEDWYWARGELPPLLLPPTYAQEGAVCQIITPGPADVRETGSLFFVEAIHTARQRLWLTSPYFVPDEAVFAALQLAVLRGVDVRLLLPSRPDHRAVYAASSLYARQAAKAGIKVLRYTPGFLHQKVLLVDDELAAVGSANLDNRSFRLNFEVVALVQDRAFAEQVEAMLLADFAQSEPLHEELPALWQRLGMRVARLVAPVL